MEVVRPDLCRSWKMAKWGLEEVGQTKQDGETEDGLKL